MTKRHVISAAAAILTTIIILLVWPPKHTFFSDNSQQGPSKLPTPAEPDYKKDSLACINALPDDLKISQKLMVAGYDSQLNDEMSFLAKMNIGGIIVMDAVPAAQLSVLHKAMNVAPFIAVDQEGGTVQRYSAEGVLPGAADMAASFSPSQAYDKYLADNRYLKNVGITTNFAPVVDVLSQAHNPLPGRMYSTDTGTVTTYASASIRASQAAGITPVIKHFPGLGSASGNTDFASATTDSVAILQTRDLLPYRQLATLHPDVMIGNVIVPGLTDGKPAVWSPAAVKLLRDTGYEQAVLYSDSLTAQAIPGTLSDAVVKAWQAGVDVALIVQTPEQTSHLSTDLDTITAQATADLHSGKVNQKDFSASLARIFARKGIDACQIRKAGT